LGLVSAGFRNQFGHPHPELVERFRVRAIKLANTADRGYLHVDLGENPGLPEAGRELRSAWWRVR
jgi:competence protein ComEC